MKIIFIRHGQGEHTLSPPESLHMHHPSLTEKGKLQAQQLADTFPLHTDDTIVISPTRRTIETSMIWSHDISCTLIVHPLVSPRMFPFVSHDGTINAYRSYFGESVTRHHFLKESESYVFHL